MSVADTIKTILGNAFALFFGIAIVTSLLKIRRARLSRRPFSAAYIVWGEMLFYVYGLANIYGGLFHAYAGPMVAATIGWKPSPFQYELGWFEIGYGLTALAAPRLGYAFRLALTLPYSIFALAAAAQHISMMLSQRDYAANNAGLVLWLGDIIIPIGMVLLAVITRDERS